MVARKNLVAAQTVCPELAGRQLASLASDSVIDEADAIVFNSRGYVFSDEGRISEAGGAREPHPRHPPSAARFRDAPFRLSQNSRTRRIVSFRVGRAGSPLPAALRDDEARRARSDAPYQVSDGLEVVERVLKKYRAVPLPGLPRFTGGAVGFIGYEFIHDVEPVVPTPPHDELHTPVMYFLIADQLLIFDRVAQTLLLLVN